MFMAAIRFRVMVAFKSEVNVKVMLKVKSKMQNNATLWGRKRGLTSHLAFGLSFASI